MKKWFLVILVTEIIQMPGAFEVYPQPGVAAVPKQLALHPEAWAILKVSSE